MTSELLLKCLFSIEETEGRIWEWEFKKESPIVYFSLFPSITRASYLPSLLHLIQALEPHHKVVCQKCVSHSVLQPKLKSTQQELSNTAQNSPVPNTAEHHEHSFLLKLIIKYT
jgi:hypothetical protein